MASSFADLLASEPPVEEVQVSKTKGVKGDIETEARQEVEKELAAEQRARLKEARKIEIRRELERERALGPEGEEMVRVRINLAPHSSKIVLDGMTFYNGLEYDVPLDKARVLVETQQRTWQHEREIGGANVNSGGSRSNEFYNVLSGRGR